MSMDYEKKEHYMPGLSARNEFIDAFETFASLSRLYLYIGLLNKPSLHEAQRNTNYFFHFLPIESRNNR